MGSKKQTNKINEQAKPNRNKHVDTENRVVVAREEGAMGWGGGIDRDDGWKLNFWW